MNSAEQTVTWLISLGVLESPKKSISDPEAFLQASLQDGAVLCRLLDRLRPGTVKVSIQDGQRRGKTSNNCSICRKEMTFTELKCVPEDNVCVPPSSTLRIKSFDSLNTQTTRSSKLLQPQYRSLDMSEGNGCGNLLVKARFAFQQTNEDELSFSKGDIIIVSRQEDGGWWEGSYNGKSGWFPSNYVRELKGSDKPKSLTMKSPPKVFDTTVITKTYYNVVLQNILEAETEFSRELQSVLGSYLRSLHPTDRISSADIGHILGNLEEISTFQQMLVQSLEEHTKLPDSQQRIGGFFLSLMPQMKSIYVAYCSNHPSAVNVLMQHSEELGEYMESKGASSPGILTLTTSLSKPFTRLERYPALLKELDRHMQDQHPDRADLQMCMAAFKSLTAQCQEMRKKKDLELQILTEPIRNWEGDDIQSLGPILHMSQTTVHTPTCQELSECYLVLFPHTLLMLSASPRMSGFIYQGRMPLSGMLISRIEDGENLRNAFEISGSHNERMQVACITQQDLQDWLDLLTKHTHTPTPHTPSYKHQSVCHTLPSHPGTPSRLSESHGGSTVQTYHTLPHPTSFGTLHSNSLTWGPLEPPSTQKPWSLSCLRPAPPLRPSAAHCQKEDLSKSPKNMKKLLPKRKPERKPSEEDFTVRKSTAALEEDAQILKVIEAYCTSAKTRQTLNSTWQGTDLMHNHVLADNSLSVAGFPGNLPCSDQSEDSDYDSIWTATSYRTASISREDREPHTEAFCCGKMKGFQPKCLAQNTWVLLLSCSLLSSLLIFKDNKRMRRTLEEEQRARKELERIIRRVLKNMNDPSWDETNL
uniref:Osteoclast-stimulating factor 1 n=1 Tax=Takifugu rubripes TaxID=31033 RepID=H2V5D0_TAKRU